MPGHGLCAQRIPWVVAFQLPWHIWEGSCILTSATINLQVCCYTMPEHISGVCSSLLLYSPLISCDKLPALQSVNLFSYFFNAHMKLTLKLP